ncbi:hypothetical protein TOPH_08137 [Tolypocladium ophioglossoides CBS 100239]|uniref:Heterokaryon incompatibility domain-containing protein n=1 Tax=Tolypocladium ophioglossoides (strain CBS 100239) TaxID=1163406 RepID=A0A0L0MZF5_TOLOC|nr:hypothetical protein TOPH_08137 [Tolypocladium ophioglossoides CBS 100239]
MVLRRQRCPACGVCEKIILLLHTPNCGDITLGSGREVLEPSQGCDIHCKLVGSALSLDVHQPPIQLSAAMESIRQIRIVKNPLNAGAIVVADTSPSPSIPRLPLSALYVLKGPRDADDLVGGRILHPKWIDVGLPARWKNTCARLHDGLCKSFLVQSLSSVRPTWLVDVQRRCLVRAPHKCSYIALSYVWGNQETLQAVRNNHTRLQEPGSLSLTSWAKPISTTTRNVMGIVELLGERHLWVDTLCIVHDDEAQKPRELANMGAIYANASVTIIAIQGEHANTGLKGFRDISEPRNLRQVVHVLTDRVKAIQNPVEANFYELACEHSIWATRGWTYQEHLLSRRRLIFDGDSLRWECTAAIWREHVEWSPGLRPDHNDIITFQSMFESPIPEFNGFAEILRNYNSRDFTYPEDTLDAFAGITSAIGWSVGGSLVSGLPTASFDVLLLWQPEKKVVRRTARDPKKRHCLPSWSWAGWSGSVQMDVASASDFIRNSPRRSVWMSSSARVTRCVSWKYHETVEAPGISIHPSILECREEWLEGRDKGTSGWTRHPISANSHARYEMPDPRSPSSCFFRHPLHPGFDFWYPIPLPGSGSAFSVVQAPCISCRTRRVWLWPAERIQRLYGYPPLFSLRNKVGTWVGVLQPQVGIDESYETLREPSEAVELVEIAKGFCRDTTSPHPGLPEIGHLDKPRSGEWYEYYWVIWVKWKSGIAYREGLGRVCKQVWESHIREEVDLMLG